MSIYLVIFGKPRYLGITTVEDIILEKGCRILIESMRGHETGIVAGSLTKDQEEKFRNNCNEEQTDGQAKGGEPMLQNVELTGYPDANDYEIMKQLSSDEAEVLQKSRKILSEHELPMKVVDVEYIHDRKKLFFYFTSEQRVDFRAYVRDLAREFKTRIELRQIGVRDEAKAVKGLGPCGLPCCCSYWLQSFTPICIKMVKEQNLALNPTKISGICGRLMCCMSYEHPTYHDLWKKLPKPDSKIKTPKGNFVINGVNIKSGSVSLRTPNGKEVMIPVDEFENVRKRITSGETLDELYQKGILVSDNVEIDKVGKDVLFTDDMIFSSKTGQSQNVKTDKKQDQKITVGSSKEEGSKQRSDKGEKQISQNSKTTDNIKNKNKRRRKKPTKPKHTPNVNKEENAKGTKVPRPARKRKPRKKPDQKGKSDK